MAFKMKMKEYGKGKNPIQFNAGLRKASAEGKLDNNPKFKEAVDSAPMKKIPESGTGRDNETGTYYYKGMAQSDRPQASTGLVSGIEVEAAKQLGSGKVNRAQKRAKKKVNKFNRSIKVGGAKRRSRVRERREDKATRTTERARDLTTKRFDKMSDLGKKEYNKVIERDNRERKERAEKRAAQKNK